MATPAMDLLQQQVDAQHRTNAAIEGVIDQLKRMQAIGGDGGGGRIDGQLDLPIIKIREEVHTWGGFAVSRRRQWPKEFRSFPTYFNLAELKMYLKGIRHAKQDTIDPYIQGLGYFYQLLIVPDAASEAEVIGSLWKGNVMRELMTLEPLNPKNSFTGKIAGGLIHYCKFLALEQVKKDTAR